MSCFKYVLLSKAQHFLMLQEIKHIVMLQEKTKTNKKPLSS